MNRLVFSLLTALVAACYGSPAQAADPEIGLDVARRWCASCHVVEESQPRASADASAFRTIARAPGYNRQRLTTFLMEPHGMMPNMALSRLEVELIVAYIETLK